MSDTGSPNAAAPRDAASAPTLPPLGGVRAIVAAADALAAANRPAVLCVVIATRGSTYRKPGALVLLDAGGVRAGALSGGCLEAELEAMARGVLAEGRARRARFDTSGDEDRVFGSGSGCGGSTEVLLLPLPPLAPLRNALHAAAAGEQDVMLTLTTDAERLGAGVAQVGTYRHAFDAAGAPDAAMSKPTAGVELRVARAPRLLLLGAGPETPPLLAHVRRIGWHATLCERRERWLRFADDAGVDALHREGGDALAERCRAAQWDAALVMNHHFELDAQALRALAPAAVPYVGLLGPPARRDELLAVIGTDAAARLRARLHAPVGLPLGGEGAEAIALAIAAELQQTCARRARG